jgi:hypothetical protein
VKRPALTLETEYRSKLERKFATQLEAHGIRFGYERRKLKFVIPERVATYTPDWDFDGVQIICETKGYFRKASDRQRLVLIKEQHPDLDIRLVFQDASKPIYKNSKTTYGQWANDHGFKWADKGTAPDEWLSEIKQAQEKLSEDPARSKGTAEHYSRNGSAPRSGRGQDQNKHRKRSTSQPAGTHRSPAPGKVRLH